MITFNIALKSFRNGTKVQSIVSKKIYFKGKNNIELANDEELKGFWRRL